MDKDKEEKIWQEVKKKNRFSHAFRGLYVFYKTTRNVKIHLFITLIVIILSFYFNISINEYFAIILAIIMVFTAEALNTSIEIDIDLTSPEYHPYARDTKDVAAAAVFIASMGAVVIGLIIFLPRIFVL